MDAQCIVINIELILPQIFDQINPRYNVTRVRKQIIQNFQFIPGQRCFLSSITDFTGK